MQILFLRVGRWVSLGYVNGTLVASRSFINAAHAAQVKSDDPNKVSTRITFAACDLLMHDLKQPCFLKVTQIIPTTSGFLENNWSTYICSIFYTFSEITKVKNTAIPITLQYQQFVRYRDAFCRHDSNLITDGCATRKYDNWVSRLAISLIAFVADLNALYAITLDNLAPMS